MKRYIRSSSYSEPYIPDMTERFPEGLDGPDMYDYNDPEDVMWDAMADDYYNALRDRIMNKWDKMSDEEFQQLSPEEYQEYLDDAEEWKEISETEGPDWERQWRY